jgi:hypothetical protein
VTYTVNNIDDAFHDYIVRFNRAARPPPPAAKPVLIRLTVKLSSSLRTSSHLRGVLTAPFCAAAGCCWFEGGSSILNAEKPRKIAADLTLSVPE